MSPTNLIKGKYYLDDDFGLVQYIGQDGELYRFFILKDGDKASFISASVELYISDIPPNTNVDKILAKYL